MEKSWEEHEYTESCFKHTCITDQVVCLTTAVSQASMNHPGDVDLSSLLVPPYCGPLTDRQTDSLTDVSS